MCQLEVQLQLNIQREEIAAKLQLVIFDAFMLGWTEVLPRYDFERAESSDDFDTKLGIDDLVWELGYAPKSEFKEWTDLAQQLGNSRAQYYLKKIIGSAA